MSRAAFEALHGNEHSCDRILTQAAVVQPTVHFALKIRTLTSFGQSSTPHSTIYIILTALSCQGVGEGSAIKRHGDGRGCPKLIRQPFRSRFRPIGSRFIACAGALLTFVGGGSAEVPAAAFALGTACAGFLPWLSGLRDRARSGRRTRKSGSAMDVVDTRRHVLRRCGRDSRSQGRQRRSSL